MKFTSSATKLVLQEQALPQNTRNSVSDGESTNKSQKKYLELSKKECSEIGVKRGDKASNVESPVAQLNILSTLERKEYIDFTTSRDCDDAMSGVSGLVTDADKIGRDFTTTWLDLGSVHGVYDLEELEKFPFVCYGGIVGSG